MAVLTGDVNPTHGEAYIIGNDITNPKKDSIRLARREIGFCPQIDPLLDFMVSGTL